MRQNKCAKSATSRCLSEAIRLTDNTHKID